MGAYLYDFLCTPGMNERTHRRIGDQCNSPLPSPMPRLQRRKKRKESLNVSPLPTRPGGRIQQGSKTAKKKIRFRRQKWVSDSKQQLRNVRLSSPNKHQVVSASTLVTSTKAEGNDSYRARCIVCCSQCMGTNKKVQYHENPWGFLTTKACGTCGEFLCTRKSSARWNGKTCWDVWHTEEELPQFDCKNKVAKV